jgi:hypothetical protein
MYRRIRSRRRRRSISTIRYYDIPKGLELPEEPLSIKPSIKQPQLIVKLPEKPLFDTTLPDREEGKPVVHDTLFTFSEASVPSIKLRICICSNENKIYCNSEFTVLDYNNVSSNLTNLTFFQKSAIATFDDSSRVKIIALVNHLITTLFLKSTKLSFGPTLVFAPPETLYEISAILNLYASSFVVAGKFNDAAAFTDEVLKQHYSALPFESVLFPNKTNVSLL